MSAKRGFLLPESLIFVFIVLIVCLLAASSISTGGRVFDKVNTVLHSEYAKEEVLSLLCSGMEIKDIAARSGLNINVKDSDNNNGMSEIHIKTESMRGTEDAVLLWPKTGS